MWEWTSQEHYDAGDRLGVAVWVTRADLIKLFPAEMLPDFAGASYNPRNDMIAFCFRHNGLNAPHPRYFWTSPGCDLFLEPYFRFEGRDGPRKLEHDGKYPEIMRPE